MGSLEKSLEKFVALVEGGQTVQAIEKYYADDVVVFENREIARTGRAACAKFEKDNLARQPRPPRIKCRGQGVDKARGKTFTQWEIRFVSDQGRLMYLEEVAVQKWSGDEIVEERFYYEGFVDEGPVGEGF
jgi:hypothetical protein